MQLMSKSGLAVAALVFAMAPAAGASAASFRGVVVHQNTRAHSFVLSGPGGRLTAVHARHLAPLGHQVTIAARQLHNGTWQATHVQVGAGAAHVRIRGVVTYVNAGRNIFVVSSRGASLLVHAHPSRGHLAHIASDLPMHVGELVNVDGELSHDSVDASEVQTAGEQTSGISLEGTILAIDTTARTLSVSADDNGESGAAVTVVTPVSFDLGAFTVGESVQLNVARNPDGTYTLQQSSDDRNGANADNRGQMQGDNHGGEHAHANQLCTAQSADPAFPSGHGGLTFTQVYERDPSDAGNAFGRCVNLLAHQQEGQNPGDGGSQAGPGSSSGSGSGSGGSDGSGSGSGSGSGGSDGSSSGSGPGSGHGSDSTSGAQR
jgi:hypothetical protein